jgi:hypothetical protein
MKQNKPIKNKPGTPPAQKSTGNSSKTTSNAPKSGMLDFLDAFFDRNLTLFFWIGLVAVGLFSFLLFDFKVSDGGDDSSYIVRAYDFIKNGLFPIYQGPLYPIFLSLFVGAFGVKVTLLKTLSLVFMLSQYVLFYKAFAKRISSTLLVSVMIITSVCASLLYFSSQTYSEAFFMMLQSAFLLFVFKYVIDRWDEEVTIKRDWAHYLILGALAVAIFWARSVGLVSIIALVLFLLSFKKWKQALFSLGGFVIVLLPLEMLKRGIFHEQSVQFSNQGKSLLLKDFYNPVKGNEDFAGLIQRFFDNAHLYLSKHLFVFMGLKPTEHPQPTHLLTYLIFALALIALIYTFKRNKYLFFSTLYTGAIAVTTFVAVQAHWDQPRLAIVFYPLLLLTLFAGIYGLLKTKGGKNLQFILPVFIIIIFFASFKSMLTTTNQRSKTLQANLSGNLYYGMTPDWVNYIEMSKYAAKNTPANELTASRKPEISFVYAGKKFYGIYNIPSIELDTFLLSLKVPASQRVVGLDLVKITESPNAQKAHNMLINYTKAFINANLLDENRTAKDSKVIGVYILPTTVADSLMPLVEATGATFVNDIPGVLNQIKRENWSFAIQDPDAMLKTLKDNNVHYAILASLRKNPQYNTGEIISTIHRYLYFLQLKYPKVVSQIHSIGDSEPATLIKFNY